MGWMGESRVSPEGQKTFNRSLSPLSFSGCSFTSYLYIFLNYYSDCKDNPSSAQICHWVDFRARAAARLQLRTDFNPPAVQDNVPKCHLNHFPPLSLMSSLSD